MSSSTSSSESGWTLGLLAAVAVVACVEWGVAGTAEHFMESQPLIYEAKLGALRDELRADVLFLGDSTAVAAVLPEAVEPAFPAGTRVANLALPGSGPVVGEFLLRRYLAENPDRPPRLVVLAFSTLSFTEWRTNFVEYPLTHLLPLGPTLRAAWAENDVGYLLEWLATRLPSVRHREEIKSGVLSLVFDRRPDLAGTWRELVGDDLRDDQFEWRYTRRAERNRRLREELLRQRGWRLFREMDVVGARLPEGVRFDRGPFRFPPFAPSERERRALGRLLELCAERGIRVLVLPAAQPRALTAALDLRGGAARLDAFAQAQFGGREGVAAPLGLRMPWPHEYFGDLAHVNRAGRDRYTQETLATLREAAADVDWASAP